MKNEYYINLNTQKIIRIVKGFHEQFPILSNVSSVHILVQLIFLTQSNETISLKKIYRSVPFAENTVRNYLRTISESGWIKFYKDPQDQRVICVSITQKFYRELILLSEELIG